MAIDNVVQLPEYHLAEVRDQAFVMQESAMQQFVTNNSRSDRVSASAVSVLEDPRPFERPGKEPLAPIPEPEPHLPSPELVQYAQRAMAKLRYSNQMLTSEVWANEMECRVQ